MNQTIVHGSGPKLRLLEAAERLFCEKGFEGVSVRDITGEAGANVAAINYHFGSRDGLVLAVMSRYLTPVNTERLARLEAVMRNPSSPAVIEEILEAFLKPLIEQVERSELSERLYCKLLGRIFGEHAVELTGDIERQIKDVIERFVRALGSVLPGLTGEELIWRLHFIAGGLIHMMCNPEVPARYTGSACGTPTMGQTVARFVRFSAAGLRDGMEQKKEKKTPQGLFDF